MVKCSEGLYLTKLVMLALLEILYSVLFALKTMDCAYSTEVNEPLDLLNLRSMHHVLYLSHLNLLISFQCILIPFVNEPLKVSINPGLKISELGLLLLLFLILNVLHVLVSLGLPVQGLLVLTLDLLVHGGELALVRALGYHVN